MQSGFFISFTMRRRLQLSTHPADLAARQTQNRSMDFEPLLKWVLHFAAVLAGKTNNNS